MNARNRIVGLLVMTCLVAGGCIGSRDTGSSFAVENNTDQLILARVKVIKSESSPTYHSVLTLSVMAVPARSRQIIAEVPFTSPQVQEIQILTADCAVIKDFISGWEKGHLLVVDDGPSVARREEFPAGPVTAQTSDLCHTGQSFAVENNTDLFMIARVYVYSFRSGDGIMTVLSLPARERLIVAEQPFASQERVNEIQILTTHCKLVADFQDWENGSLLVINEGPRVERREEWPAGPVTAQPSDLCPPTQDSFAVAVENNTDQLMLARVRVYSNLSGDTTQTVVSLPAKTRLIVAAQSWRSQDAVIDEIQILTTACTVIADYDAGWEKGSLLVINEGPRVERHMAWPISPVTAQASNLCTGPSPSPTS